MKKPFPMAMKKAAPAAKKAAKPFGAMPFGKPAAKKAAGKKAAGKKAMDTDMDGMKCGGKVKKM